MRAPAFTTLSPARLQERADQSAAAMVCCTLCPRACRVNRHTGETGYCRTGLNAVVASYHAHFGEEAPLVGRNGSGTIFFSHCNLLCTFCQNFDTSHLGHGTEVTDRQLAGMMLHLQSEGCHNINLVTPSHVVPQILAATALAAAEGLSIPLVYNTGGYDTVDSLALLDGVVDIYMPDFKFWDAQVARQVCRAPDYRQVACTALKEMHRQVGGLVIDADGVARRGLLVRHLVMPDGLSGTRRVMHFIASEVSRETYVNLMAQYRPCGLASEDPLIGKPLAPSTYLAALEAARSEGITRLDERRPIFLC